jgi:predicted outer membrane repeat protein
MLCTGSDLTIRNNVFDSNEANGQGGGIACEIGASPVIEGNRFVNNRAVAAGGAIYCGGGAAVITANLFESNVARDGAAVHYRAAGSIIDNLFRQNLAAGGVEADLAIIDGIVSGPAVMIAGNVFHDNTSAVLGVSAPSTTIRQNTMIRGVTGIAGATGNPVEIDRNLSVSHASTGVRWTGADPTFICNDVWNNPIAYDGVADPTGILGNISEDPLHCSPLENIFTVAENSPCAPGEPGGCGQIGALAVGCEPSAVEAVTWGAIKAAFGDD